jgi:hypothetical protein
MPWWRMAVATMMAASAWAQSPGSVAAIVATVRGGLESRQSDSNVAKALHKVKPAQRIDTVVVEELESEGAGPKAVEELERLAELSSDLPDPNPAPVFSHPPAPSEAERRGILQGARRIALNYTRSLPDFICTEMVRRFENGRGSWELKDTLEVKLSYFDQKEEYHLLRRNGRASVASYRDVGGAVTEGEFGSTLASIFAPDSQTEFRWDHWTTLRKRTAHVFTFHIAVEHSTYKMEYGTRPGMRTSSVITGQHGAVYVDAETNQVVRLISDSDSIPPDFPVQIATTALDYGFVDVGDRKYLLPLRAEVRMATSFLRVRNLVEFNGYRKFAGESTITFH